MTRKLTFADRVLLLRREMKLSQSAFAELLHIGRSWMSQLEKGEEPSPMLVGLFEKIEREWAERHQAGHTTEEVASYVTGARGKLRHAREAKGYTPAQMAKRMGYSQVGTYIDIEEGRSQMGEKMARKAAEILDLDVSELMSGSDHPIERGAVVGTFGAVPDIHLPPGMTAKYVPLLAMAQCGPNMAWDDGGYTHQGFLAFNPEDPKAFAVTLAGDSMMPRIEPGDVALIYPSQQPKNGKVVLARLNEDKGGDVLVKVYQANGDTITLSSYNHGAYPPMQFHRGDFAWIYPVAKITKDM
ncbi:S24 family peptidase [Prosthecobacter vanneervenii]|uniref:Transcriptional regulator with XRE-family HTH domain n=1 Tax=Prosthecobacter vanneervenii TaxID=48466 RepID=A0A7W8DKF5_9BACT|nr:S24 family peptidase [Prosthecobacter vanneervenii]MBB5033153.1 transcriptional regulator with XRE-family HTH domain [Prosthecobacter vanneervenii]